MLVRRIHLHYETADHGRCAAPRVAALLGQELGWEETRTAEALARYIAWLEKGTGNGEP